MCQAPRSPIAVDAGILLGTACREIQSPAMHALSTHESGANVTLHFSWERRERRWRVGVAAEVMGR